MSSDQTDIELGDPTRHTTLLEGYAEFAHFTASDPQLSIYRKYERLAAQNLLYLEADVQLLEAQLQEMDAQDMRILESSNDQDEKVRVEEAARCWDALIFQAEKKEERAMARLNLILRLRKCMEQYETALLRRRQISALCPPDHNSAEAFVNWFTLRKPLRGSGYDLLVDESDLCTLYSGVESDRLSALIQRYGGWYVRTKKEIPKSWSKSLYYYPPSRIAWIVAILSVLIASVLLIGAIVALYFVREMSKRLGIIAVFTGCFAGSLGLLTSARRAEIFAATAAYSAVLVVFVGVDS